MKDIYTTLLTCLAIAFVAGVGCAGVAKQTPLERCTKLSKAIGHQQTGVDELTVHCPAVANEKAKHVCETSLAMASAKLAAQKDLFNTYCTNYPVGE